MYSNKLRDRLVIGDNGVFCEDQLQKLAKKLATMSPEDLASFAAGLPSVKKASEDGGLPKFQMSTPSVLIRPNRPQQSLLGT